MMTTGKARVGVNGYGVIGKRVADAVKLQPDMDLVGVADVGYDYRIRIAVERGYPIFASAAEKRAEMEAAGIPVAGTLDDLLRQPEDGRGPGHHQDLLALHHAADQRASRRGGECGGPGRRPRGACRPDRRWLHRRRGAGRARAGRTTNCAMNCYGEDGPSSVTGR
jgi:hypothetical protein